MLLGSDSPEKRGGVPIVGHGFSGLENLECNVITREKDVEVEGGFLNHLEY